MVLSLVTRGRNYRCRCKIVKDKFQWQDWFKGKWGKYADLTAEEEEAAEKEEEALSESKKKKILLEKRETLLF